MIDVGDSPASGSNSSTRSEPEALASSTPPSLTLRRAVHISVYDKNPDEQVRPTVVPDYVIQLQSDNYWAPHPQTGVFGPATDHNLAAAGERGFHSSPANGGVDSVLDQKAFFRPLENLEKPSHP
ncbi:hypothetical protein F0562_026822 [Nyssa sinensis]|uniref:Uncharacterized protein n=1 Tax=Nyssa sinensis TaxID=561372 RepID=A0A5J5BCN5_9ASTE|nr:hypothetical protein F0562_026822 [Nyssa sinensis]